MRVYVHLCLDLVRRFQHWLKAKGSHNTVIIMSLKRVTSGSWGASSSTESHLFLSFAPCDTDNALIPSNNLPILHTGAVRVWLWHGVGRGVWFEGGRTGGSHQEMDGECFEWETCLHSSRSTWVSALHRWSKRHSEDGRDEMRTGGGLLLNEEWSSPVGVRKAQPTEHSGLRLHSRNPAARRSQWATDCVQNKNALQMIARLIWVWQLQITNLPKTKSPPPEQNEQCVINDIPRLHSVFGQGPGCHHFVLWLNCSHTPNYLKCPSPQSALCSCNWDVAWQLTAPRPLSVH